MMHEERQPDFRIPTHKLKPLNPKEVNIVLLALGSFSPFHLGHRKLLDDAQIFFEGRDDPLGIKTRFLHSLADRLGGKQLSTCSVVGSYISPSPDSYLGQKMLFESAAPFFTNLLRCRIAEAATNDSDIIMVDYNRGRAGISSEKTILKIARTISKHYSTPVLPTFEGLSWEEMKLEDLSHLIKHPARYYENLAQKRRDPPAGPIVVLVTVSGSDMIRKVMSIFRHKNSLFFHRCAPVYASPRKSNPGLVRLLLTCSYFQRINEIEEGEPQIMDPFTAPDPPSAPQPQPSGAPLGSGSSHRLQQHGSRNLIKRIVHQHDLTALQEFHPAAAKIIKEFLLPSKSRLQRAQEALRNVFSQNYFFLLLIGFTLAICAFSVWMAFTTSPIWWISVALSALLLFVGVVLLIRLRRDALSICWFGDDDADSGVTISFDFDSPTPSRSPEIQGATAHRANEIHQRAVELEPEITEVVKKFAQKAELTLVDLENRIKSREAITVKLLRKGSSFGSNNNFDAKSVSMNDTIRYRMISKPSSLYTKRLIRFFREAIVIRKYCTIYRFANTWSANGYRGINVAVRRRSDGAIFELQFHTAKSHNICSENHKIYERSRENVLYSSSTMLRTQLQRQTAEMFARAKPPPGATALRCEKQEILFGD